MLSTVSSTSVEDVSAARGEPVWYQLYPTDQWTITQALVRRAKDAGCPVLALTVDLQGGSNRLTLTRSIPRDSRDCTACHSTSRTRLSGFITGKPMFAGLDTAAATDLTPPDMTWDYLKRLRDIWPRKLMVKGLVTREDAELAIEHGVDGIVVSNHGGRAEDSGRPAIDSLAEVAEGVKGRVPLIVDGGFRRGSDIFKALALGANAVGIGRPYIWGLASFGQAGVERVLDILRQYLRSRCARREREALPRSIGRTSWTTGAPSEERPSTVRRQPRILSHVHLGCPETARPRHADSVETHCDRGAYACRGHRHALGAAALGRVPSSLRHVYSSPSC